MLHHLPWHRVHIAVQRRRGLLQVDNVGPSLTVLQDLQRRYRHCRHDLGGRVVMRRSAVLNHAGPYRLIFDV